MMKRLFALMFCIAGSCLLAGDFVVKEGTAVQIVLPDSLPHEAMYRSLERGTQRLASALRFSFGAEVPVVRESAAKAGVKTISIGMTKMAAAKGLQPQPGFNYVLSADDELLCIAGYDQSRMKKVYNPHRPPQEEFYLGSLRGMVEFMETRMNVRFLWPGENGTDYAKLSELRVPAGTVKSAEPRLMYAGGGYPTYLDPVYDYALGWYGRGGWQMYGGHSIRNIASEALFKAHPEYFALISGVRQWGGHHHFCLSNPAVLELYHNTVAEALEEGAQAYEIGVDDSYQACECEKCKAVHPKETERVWIFYRQLAEKMAKTHPDKDLVLISYGHTVKPPETFDTFPGNVYIELCHFTEQDFAAWKRYKGIKGFSVYAYTWGYYWIQGFTPKQTPESLQRELQLIAENQVKGIYRCGFGENYGLDGVLYYVQGKFLRDPSLDLQTLENEFYERAFHEAAPVMREFFRKMHEQLAYAARLRGETAMPGEPQDYWRKRVLSRDPREVIQMLWTSTLLKALERDMTSAERVAKDPKVKARLALVRLELDYAKHLSHSLRAYSAYLDQPDQAGFDKVETAVKARRAFLDALCDKDGRIKPLAGWPELLPFGGSPMKGFGATRKVLEINGRLEAPIAGPLVWDFENYRKQKVLPDATRKSLTAKFTPSFPPLNIQDPVWKSVEWGRLNPLDTASGKAGGWFKLLYDKENLYVLAQSAVPKDRVYEAKGRSDAVYRTDCLEFFVDPEGLGSKYYHFVVNPVENSFMDGAFGLVTDPIDLRYNTYDEKWDGQWRYHTRRLHPVESQPHHWWVMLVLPYKTLGVPAPEAGTIWNMDCGRVAFDVPGDWKNVRLYLWSAPEGKFHDRQNFGELVFE